MREIGRYIEDIIHNFTSGALLAIAQDLGGNSSYGDSPTPGFEISYYLGKIFGHAWTTTLVAIMMDTGKNMTIGGTVASESGVGIVISVGGVLVIVKGFEVIIDVGTNLGKDFGALIQEFGKQKKNSGSNIPVEQKTRASNGLDYQSNPKHTPGQAGSRPNAGIEPKNSLELFEESVESVDKPDQRYTYDETTGTLHRFFNDGNGTWHWSGSTNQGENSLRSSDVPSDIKNLFNLRKKGW